MEPFKALVNKEKSVTVHSFLETGRIGLVMAVVSFDSDGHFDTVEVDQLSRATNNIVDFKFKTLIKKDTLNEKL